MHTKADDPASVVSREHPANSVLIQVQSERQVDLLSDTGTAVSWIAPFPLNSAATTWLEQFGDGGEQVQK